MQDTILSIAGRSGLYKLIAQGRGMLIVETVDATRRRFPAGARDRVTSLNDVSMYTDGDDVPLMRVFQNIADRNGGAPVELDYRTATPEALAAFMAEALPEYDRDRVHMNDIKKLIQWYNILVGNGYKEFVQPEQPADASASAAEEPAPAAAE